jgi:hypothetical protein
MKWFSVSEKLPDKAGRYLVKVRRKASTTYIAETADFRAGMKRAVYLQGIDEHFNIIGHVSHWAEIREDVEEIITKLCCDVFEKVFEREFALYRMEMGLETEGNQFLVLPHLEFEGNRYRVNYCPSCGAYVGDIQLSTKMNTDKL